MNIGEVMKHSKKVKVVSKGKMVKKSKKSDKDDSK
jgi:hypothetical protein